MCRILNDHVLIPLHFVGLEQKPKPTGTPPTFKDKPKVNQDGNNLIIECECAAAPKPTLTWYRENKVVMPGPRYKMRTVEKGKDNYMLYMDILVGVCRSQ